MTGATLAGTNRVGVGGRVCTHVLSAAITTLRLRTLTPNCGRYVSQRTRYIGHIAGDTSATRLRTGSGRHSGALRFVCSVGNSCGMYPSRALHAPTLLMSDILQTCSGVCTGTCTRRATLVSNLLLSLTGTSMSRTLGALRLSACITRLGALGSTCGTLSVAHASRCSTHIGASAAGTHGTASRALSLVVRHIGTCTMLRPARTVGTFVSAIGRVFHGCGGLVTTGKNPADPSGSSSGPCPAPSPTPSPRGPNNSDRDPSRV